MIDVFVGATTTHTTLLMILKTTPPQKNIKNKNAILKKTSNKETYFSGVLIFYLFKNITFN